MSPQGLGAATIAGWQLTAGGLVLVPLALAFEGLPFGLDLRAIGGYAWLSVVDALLSYPIWFHGIGKLAVVAVSFPPHRADHRSHRNRVHRSDDSAGRRR